MQIEKLPSNQESFALCWVKYGQTQQLACFDPAIFCLVTQPLGQNNPVAGFVHIIPNTALFLTQSLKVLYEPCF